MNSIEMSDVDGDALTIIRNGNRAWITCTSGRDEVTVGPFPAHLLRRTVLSGSDADGGSAVMIGRPEQQPVAEVPLGARERAWAAFARHAESVPLREAVDLALEAAAEAVAADHSGTTERGELARALGQISHEDAGAVADHLLSLGYRKA